MLHHAVVLIPAHSIKSMRRTMITKRHTRFYMPIAAILLMLMLAACDSNNALSDPEPRTHVPTTNDSGKPAYDIKYTVTSRGDGAVTFITYRDANGVLHTVEDPVLPWSRSFVMHSGDQASLSANGSASDGTLLLSMSVIGEHDSMTFNNGCGKAPPFPFPLWGPSCDNLNVDAFLP